MNSYERLHLLDAKEKIEYCLKYETQSNKEELWHCVKDAIEHLNKAAREMKPANKRS